MLGGICLQKFKQVVSLAGLGAEVDVGQEYRADLLHGHVRLTAGASLHANILDSFASKLAPTVIDEYSMRAEWHENISALLPKYFSNVNSMLPADIEISHWHHKSVTPVL